MFENAGPGPFSRVSAEKPGAFSRRRGVKWRYTYLVYTSASTPPSAGQDSTRHRGLGAGLGKWRRLRRSDLR